MKILLVHPSDSLEAAAQTQTKWDLVVDLGWSGRYANLELANRIGAPVLSIFDLLGSDQHLLRIRELHSVGRGRLVDSESVDWWDAYSPYPHDQLDQLLLLEALNERTSDDAEIVCTRPHFATQALSLLSNGKKTVRVLSGSAFAAGFNKDGQGLLARSRRYLSAALRFRPSQLAQIMFDKWDADYDVRHRFAPVRKRSVDPVILLPSAYVNVSRAQVAYARMLPHRRFLQVVTRRNGRLPEVPENVEVCSLASYASGPELSTNDEEAQLLAEWQKLENDLAQAHPLLRVASELHWFDSFPKFLKRGLRVRDAWRNVFAREPINAVLSADEYNPFTRWPIWLAKTRKVKTVFCDHGALNMSFSFRPAISDLYIVRDGMARDYYLTFCGMPAELIEVGAAAEVASTLRAASPDSAGSTSRDWIVFYSEAYELFLGRSEVLYSQLLPELCRLAKETNRRVVVKLHPFESLRQRRTFVNRLLTEEQRSLIEIREGPMTPELFDRAWCSFTVESSVAVESTLKGVPCFLCSWFDPSWYNYGAQYAKYAAGHPLNGPEAVRDVPRLVAQLGMTETTRKNLQSAISPERLDELLCGN